MAMGSITDGDGETTLFFSKSSMPVLVMDVPSCCDSAAPAPGGAEGAPAPAEEGAPQANESLENSIEKIKNIVPLDEEKAKVLDRILQKQRGKAK